MTKADLIKKIASKNNVTQKEASKIIDDIFDEIAEAVLRNEKFAQNNFGTFECVEKAARKGRNIKTEEPIEIPPTKGMKLIISKSLKERFNDVYQDNNE